MEFSKYMQVLFFYLHQTSIKEILCYKINFCENKSSLIFLTINSLNCFFLCNYVILLKRGYFYGKNS